MARTENPGNASSQLYHFVLFQGGGRDQIDRKLITTIEAYLEAEIATEPNKTHIDLWLESPGGDAHSAYKIILALRHRCCKLRVIVPDYAKSAATLMAIGADEIFMASTAELGPLDAQVPHPDREETTISALDIADCLETISQTAYNIGVASAGDMLPFGGKRAEVLKLGLEFASTLLRPVVDKLDPHLLHKARNQLRIAEEYAGRMLQLRNLESGFELSTEKQKELVDTLVKAYPAHGFVISRDEAAELGLPITKMEKHPRLEQIRQLHKVHRKNGQEGTPVHVIHDASFDQTTDQEEVTLEEEQTKTTDITTNGELTNEAASEKLTFSKQSS